MKHLGISGGGTKITGLFGAAEVIMTDKGYRPDIISGISAGAVLAVPLALGKFDEVRQVLRKLELSDFFSTPPVKANGKIRLGNALWQVARRKHYLGEQFALEDTLAAMVSEAEFAAYKADASKAVCIVGSVDFYTGRRWYFNLKEASYQQFLKYVNASASIPLFTTGIEIEGELRDFEGNLSQQPRHLLYDGGVRDHSPSGKILTSNMYAITHSCTLFSRPKSLSQMLSPDDLKQKNLLSILERYIEITNAEVSKNDEAQERELLLRKGITNCGPVYLPRILSGFYDITPERLEQLYQAGRKAAQEQFKQEDLLA